MNFENWYNRILTENEAIASDVATKVSTSIDSSKTEVSIPNTPSREDIMSDVDTIMTQLNQLSAQVKEDYREIELEWGFESLSENLVLEGAWDDAKSSYGNLFSDPVFQLVGLGITGVVAGLGLSVAAVAKYIKDTKRNKAIAKQVLGDYERLKKQKLDELQQEAIIQKLELKRDQIGAEENESFTNIQEADPAVAKKPVAKKPAAQKTVVDPESKEAQIQKMKARMTAQITALQKKKDVLSAGIQKLEEFLDKKYKSTDNDGNSKITGFGSKKVHKLIAQAEDDVQITVDEARLKLMGDEMDPEMKKKVAQRINKLKQESAQRSAAIEKEAEENAKKVKEIAAEDEETKNALADLEKNKGKEDSEDTDAQTAEPSSDKPETTQKSEPSDAEKAAAAQQDKDKKNAEDAETYKAQRAEADKKKQDKEKEDQKSAEKEASKNTKDGKLARIEDLIKKEEDKVSKNPEAEKIKSKISEYEKAIEDLKNKEKKDKGDQDKIDMISTAIEAEKKKLSKVSGSEKLDKLKKLKDEIAAKENWQLEGTELGRLYEMEISRLEAEYAINENKYLSVADKFRMLLG